MDRMGRDEVMHEEHQGDDFLAELKRHQERMANPRKWDLWAHWYNHSRRAERALITHDTFYERYLRYGYVVKLLLLLAGTYLAVNTDGLSQALGVFVVTAFASWGMLHASVRANSYRSGWWDAEIEAHKTMNSPGLYWSRLDDNDA